ncbi:MAG: cob(I)yrinic acid a,c-diamide adenosyltransferase [Gammaproteobacteria bacterium]|nr:cob(I)yrinic acid a,c-diamide adenosyltransferase [Gammaproteobacteria bacterium]
MAYHTEGRRGYRLSRIVTRTGDKGLTGLSDGNRIGKDSARIEALGDVDELNCAIGLVLAHEPPKEIKRCLDEVQQYLFEVGAEISHPSADHRVGKKEVDHIEKQLAFFNATLPPLREFIMPGGTPVVATCHLARSICRRTERHVVTLNAQETLNPQLIAFLNRLSDLLFVVARSLGQAGSSTEVQWRPMPPTSGGSKKKG